MSAPVSEGTASAQRILKHIAPKPAATGGAA